MDAEYAGVESFADQAFRDAMRRVFNRKPQPKPKYHYKCPRCNQFKDIPPYRLLCEGCWNDMGRPGGGREFPVRHVAGSIPGHKSRQSETSGIAYHGGYYHSGEW